MGTHATDQRRPPQLDYQKPSELSDKCCCCCSTQRELAPDPQARDTRATIAMDGGVADTTRANTNKFRHMRLAEMANKRERERERVSCGSGWSVPCVSIQLTLYQVSPQKQDGALRRRMAVRVNSGRLRPRALRATDQDVFARHVSRRPLGVQPCQWARTTTRRRAPRILPSSCVPLIHTVT
jgi:hypothetical protein